MDSLVAKRGIRKVPDIHDYRKKKKKPQQKSHEQLTIHLSISEEGTKTIKKEKA